MTHTQIIEKTKTAADIIDFAYSLNKNQDDCTVSVHSMDDNDCLISMRGEFGNIRIMMKNKVVKVFNRTWNNNHSEFTDVEMVFTKLEPNICDQQQR